MILLQLLGVPLGGHDGLPPEGVGDVLPHGFRSCGFAVGNEHSARRYTEVSEPGEDLGIVRMGRHRIELNDLGLHRPVLAMDS